MEPTLTVAFPKLIAHLLQGTRAPFWGGHDLPEIVAELRVAADKADINIIVGEAIRLGLHKAGSDCMTLLLASGARTSQGLPLRLAVGVATATVSRR
ncbi:hypothetical protein ACFPJ1_23380 [Kribbella qitaiheensis]|uniref:hypothetical protein n=1 Tax=Kribbella qitaiheensis TaxID=1544730 RepID=UPI00361E374D